MTPKEKAIELLEKFSKTHIIAVENKKGKLVCPYTSFYAYEIVRNDRAKQCALIAVNEIMKATGDHTYNYWEQVKNEIEKL